MNVLNPSLALVFGEKHTCKGKSFCVAESMYKYNLKAEPSKTPIAITNPTQPVLPCQGRAHPSDCDTKRGADSEIALPFYCVVLLMMMCANTLTKQKTPLQFRKQHILNCFKFVRQRD